MSTIHDLFDRMDRWRHLPAYQLERRADLFFSLYLPDVVAKHTGAAVDADIIPELPIRRDLIWPEKPTHASVKVDYALFATDRSKLFLVELKTDDTSRRDQQDVYLQRCVDLGCRAIVQGIIDISRKTKAHQKYGHLLHALAQHGCLRCPPGLGEQLWPSPRAGLRRQLDQIEVTVDEQEFAVEILYVQPQGSGHDIIDFETFASHVERQEDAVSQRFASSLRAWAQRAGHSAFQRS